MMYKRTVTAITLAITTALLVFPAQAETEALLIGTARSSEVLTDLRTILNTDFDIDNIQVATTDDIHKIAEHVRKFLAAPSKLGELRIVWVDGGADACPRFDEDPVRPQTQSLIIAPTCVKLLVQAPTTYERLEMVGQNDRSIGTPKDPAVAFVSYTEKKSHKVFGALPKLTGTLVHALACSQRDNLILDFSPSVAAWDINSTGCQIAEQVAIAPPPSHPAEASSSNVSVPDKVPGEESQKNIPTSPMAFPATALDDKFQFFAPVKGRVVSAYGSQNGDKTNKGIDLEVPVGTVAKAAESGEVVFVGELPGYGHVVAIRHNNDWATVYARTATPRVVQGQKVSRGEELANVDPVANRLHFEIRRKGKPMDPEALMLSDNQ